MLFRALGVVDDHVARGGAAAKLPPDFDEDLLALGGFPQANCIFGIGNRLVIDFDDDIAVMQAGFVKI